MAEEPSRALPTEATEEHSTSTEDPETEEQHNETQVPETEEQPNTGEQPRGPESDRASIEPPTDAPQRRSIRSTAGKPATRFEPANTANVIQSHAFVASLLDDSPMSYTEAMRSPHATEWRAAFKTELKAILDNGTFSFVDPPDYKINPVKTKWIGKVKRRADGEVERFKGRLVAKGFTQVYGCDYFETFAPVVRAQTLRTTLALTAIHNLRTSVIDIDTAFLNGVLDEEVYIKTPDGFWDLMQEIDPRLRQHLDDRYPNGRFVIRLAKGLYGLKQSAKVWNDNLNDHLLSRSFQRSKADPCAYYKQLDKVNFVIVLTYVDDIVITATRQQSIDEEITAFKNRYRIKELGVISWLLGMHVERTKDGSIKIDQHLYIEALVARFANYMPQHGPKLPTSEPTLLQANLSPDPGSEESAKMNAYPYANLVGALLYASTMTRPDIAFAVSQVARFMANPAPEHWSAAIKILAYLRNTSTVGLMYKRNGSPDLQGYVDASYAACLDTSRSTTGFVFTLAGGPVSWQSKRQSTVALSTAEAEYMALCDGTKEALFMRQILADIGFKPTKPTALLEDNKAAILMTAKPIHHQRSKHIHVRFHFTREAVERGEIKIEYVNTSAQLADYLTKALPKDAFLKCRGELQE
jgi:hypothetical protein